MHAHTHIHTYTHTHIYIHTYIGGYLCAVQEQEIETKALRKLREKDIDNKRNMNTKCRLCHVDKENMFHISAPFPYFSSNLYLNSGHNPIAKNIYEQIVMQKLQKEETSLKTIKVPPPIKLSYDAEIWWDKPITAVSKMPHNRPDIVVWDKTNKTCKVIDICVPWPAAIAPKF